ncbi:MAG TPA: hypothetical protein VIT18_06750, partial [Terrimicrobiaceae bacterium]
MSKLIETEGWAVDAKPAAPGLAMKKVISISEIVAPVQVEDDLCEVWASAEANFHEGKLEVKLDSFVRRSSNDEHFVDKLA